MNDALLADIKEMARAPRGIAAPIDSEDLALLLDEHGRLLRAGELVLSTNDPIAKEVLRAAVKKARGG